jgi:hypothetical protein
VLLRRRVDKRARHIVGGSTIWREHNQSQACRVRNLTTLVTASKSRPVARPCKTLLLRRQRAVQKLRVSRQFETQLVDHCLRRGDDRRERGNKRFAVCIFVRFKDPFIGLLIVFKHSIAGGADEPQR